MKKALPIIFILFVLSGLILAPQECLTGARGGLTLCWIIIIPSLFPFLICSKLLVEAGIAKKISKWCEPIMRPLFNIPGCGSIAFVLGILSGYPIGAKCAVELYDDNLCTKAEAERMVAFCNNSGPLFIIGSVGIGFLFSYKAGLLLYIAHVLSAITVGIIFRNYKKMDKIDQRILTKKPHKGKNFGQAIAVSVEESVQLILYICGFIIFFSVVIAILSKFGFIDLFVYLLSLIKIPSDIATAISFGLLEITNGIAKVSLLNIGYMKLVIISGLLAFSGCSVLLQVLGITISRGLSTKVFVAAKAMQALFATFYCLLLVRIPILATPVFAGQTVIKATVAGAFMYALFMLCTAIVLIMILLIAGYFYSSIHK